MSKKLNAGGPYLLSLCISCLTAYADGWARDYVLNDSAHVREKSYAYTPTLSQLHALFNRYACICHTPLLTVRMLSQCVSDPTGGGRSPLLWIACTLG